MVVFDGTGGGVIAGTGKRNYGGSAIDPTIPAPGDGDIYYNTVLRMWMKYDSSRSKWFSMETQEFLVGRQGVTAAGAYYRGVDGRQLSATLGFVAPRNGTVVEVGYTRGDTDAAVFEVVSNGAPVGTLASSAIKGSSTTLNGDFNTGDVLAVRNQAGGNATSDVVAWFTVRWRI
jgi:hypothetical protein